MQFLFENECYTSPMKLGEKIVELRKEKDWTLVDLSKAVGITPNNLNRFEKGHSKPSLETIRKLAEVFNVSTDYLLFDEAPKENRLHVFDPVFIKFLENAERLPEEDKVIARGVLKALLIKNRVEVVLQNPIESELAKPEQAKVRDHITSLRKVAGKR